MKEGMGALQTLIEKIIEFSVNYSFQVIGAFIILFAGILLGKWVSRIILKICEKKKLDVTLSGFMASIGKILVLVFAVIIALGKFGITIAPFIAALGAIAFGATYAIQGPLSNYGAGIAIILGRPFIVGNTINVAGVSGVVEQVKLAFTILTTEDGEKITIPNKHIVGEILTNSAEHRIVEGCVGVSYSDDPDKAIQVVRSVLATFDSVTKEPSPQVGLEKFGDSSIDIGYRYWVPTKKYYQTLFAVNLAIFKALQKEGICIPFPQRDIYIKEHVTK
ncbi:MAG: mechanosensitive ion channel family protein [Chlamydiota bacterium]|nr:mechanosensitive ion channel family protein [Chlamydiota bacterium]